MCSHWWWSANRVRLIRSTCWDLASSFLWRQTPVERLPRLSVTLSAHSCHSEEYLCFQWHRQVFVSSFHQTLSLVRQHLKSSLAWTWYLTHSGLDFGLFAVFNLGYSAHMFDVSWLVCILVYVRSALLIFTAPVSQMPPRLPATAFFLLKQSFSFSLSPKCSGSYNCWVSSLLLYWRLI